MQLFAAEYNLDKSEKSRAAATKDAVFPIRTHRSSEPRSQGIRPPLPIPRKSARNGNMSASTGLCGPHFGHGQGPNSRVHDEAGHSTPMPANHPATPHPAKTVSAEKVTLFAVGKNGEHFYFRRILSNFGE
ncbi:hypothetical protein [Alistipes putredinis]|uniref:hypothetical protein n=1 Tax=Alistipes putredinis TaxID=28117 RepID=UPI003AB2C89A